jgi:transposase
MPRQYTQDFRERAIRLVDESLEGTDRSEYVVITEVATRLGCSTEALRRWRRHKEVDTGQRPGTSTTEHAEIRRLKREVAELKRANEILSTASAFFASRLDHPSPK